MTHDPKQTMHLIRAAYAMQRLPVGGCVVCPPSLKAVYQKAAKKIGRKDIKIVAPNQLTGMKITSVIVDELVTA